LQTFCSSFSFTKTETSQKQKRTYWRDRLAEGNIQLDSYVPDAKRQKTDAPSELSMESLVSHGCSDVGSINPVADFRHMLARRDVDLVDKAIEQMQERIVAFVNESIGAQLYPKAIECLEAMRNGCVQEEESAKFNQFLHHLRALYAQKRRHDFWTLVCDAKLALISTEEANDSVVTAEEAKQFVALEEKEGLTTADDLFDMIE